MTKKLRYESWSIIDSLCDLTKRNEKLWYESEEYTLDEATEVQKKIETLVENYGHSSGKIIKGDEDAYLSLKQEIYTLNDRLEFREKALKKRKIRNGISYGVGVLLAPTGIPACIIGAKKIKEAIEELGD